MVGQGFNQNMQIGPVLLERFGLCLKGVVYRYWMVANWVGCVCWFGWFVFVWDGLVFGSSGWLGGSKSGVGCDQGIVLGKKGLKRYWQGNCCEKNGWNGIEVRGGGGDCGDGGK